MVIEPGKDCPQYGWKPLFIKDEEKRPSTIESMIPREIRTPNFTVMNRRTPMNLLVSTDPRPQWKAELDKKAFEYKKLLKTSLKKDYTNSKYKSQRMFDNFQQTSTSELPMMASIKSYDSNAKDWK